MRHTSWLWGGAVFGAVLWGGASCGNEFRVAPSDDGKGGGTTSTATSSTGTSSGQSGVGGGGVGGGETGGQSGDCDAPGDTCGQCQHGACGDEYCTCAATPSCPALLECMVGCTDADSGRLDPGACVRACWNDHPFGFTSAVPVVACTSEKCSGDCPAYAKLPACEGCLMTDCTEALVICAGSPNCPDFVECLFACIETNGADALGSCAEACEQSNQGGQEEGMPVLQCAVDQCVPECG